MNPKGGKSHLTPMFQRLRLFTAAGSAGSFGLAAGFFGFAEGVATDDGAVPREATPSEANTAAATNTATPISVIRFIRPLLPRWTNLRVSQRVGAFAAGTCGCAPSSVGRGCLPDRPARRCCLRP